MTTAAQAIREAESILPGQAAPEGATDPRWQAIIRVAEFVESDPESLWDFARCWGSSPDEDLRAAIATCLLEHLLEHHFGSVFPKVQAAAHHDALFADTVLHCWAFGQAKEPENASRFAELKAGLASHAG